MNRLAQHYPVQCHWGVGLFSCKYWEVFLVLHLKQNKKLFLLEYAKQSPKCVLWRQCWQSRRKLYGQFNAKLSKRAQVLFRHKAENPQRLTEESWDCFFFPVFWVITVRQVHGETGYIWKSISTSVGTSVGNQAPGEPGWAYPVALESQPNAVCVCGPRAGDYFLAAFAL